MLSLIFIHRRNLASWEIPRLYLQNQSLQKVRPRYVHTKYKHLSWLQLLLQWIWSYASQVTSVHAFYLYVQGRYWVQFRVPMSAAGIRWLSPLASPHQINWRKTCGEFWLKMRRRENWLAVCPAIQRASEAGKDRLLPPLSPSLHSHLAMRGQSSINLQSHQLGKFRQWHQLCVVWWTTSSITLLALHNCWTR